MFLRRKPQIYSRAEYISDAIVHISGLALAIIAAPILVGLTVAWLGDPRAIAAVSIYAVSLIMMLFCSALYNMIKHSDWTDRLRRLDQSAIYVKIAGTYTPFLMLSGSRRGLLLIAIWTLALAGAAAIVFLRRHVVYLAIVLYLALGWAGAFFWDVLLANLSPTSLGLVMVAAASYTSGVIFLIWERLPHHVTIWHVFVLIGTSSAYAALVVEIARAANLAA